MAGAFSRCPTFHLRRCVHSRLFFLFSRLECTFLFFFFFHPRTFFFVTFLFVCLYFSLSLSLCACVCVREKERASSVIGENRVVISSINNTKSPQLNERTNFNCTTQLMLIVSPHHLHLTPWRRVEGNETTLPYKSLRAFAVRCSVEKKKKKLAELLNSFFFLARLCQFLARVQL